MGKAVERGEEVAAFLRWEALKTGHPVCFRFESDGWVSFSGAIL